MAQYFVDATKASDAGNGLSEANAKKTIAAALTLAGDDSTIELKNNASHPTAAALVESDKRITIRGYTTTPGDGGVATIVPTADSIFGVLSIQYGAVQDVIVDCTGRSGVTAVWIDGTGVGYSRVKVIGAVDGFWAVNGSGTSVLVDCWADQCERGFRLRNAAAFRCAGTRCTSANCFLDYGNTQSTLVRFLAAGGAAGIFGDGSGTGVAALDGCVFHGASGHGLDWYRGDSLGAPAVRNCAFTANGAYGARYTASGIIALAGRGNNTYWSNTSGARQNFPAGTGDVTPSGDPWANSAGYSSAATLDDLYACFAPNSTAGAGASLRAAGFPANLDIGAYQHAEAGGGASIHLRAPIQSNTYRYIG